MHAPAHTKLKRHGYQGDCIVRQRRSLLYNQKMMKSKRLERVAKILTEDDSCAERIVWILYV